LLPSWDTPLQSMVKLKAENDMKAEFCRLAMVVRVFVAMSNLLGDSWLIEAALASVGGSTWEVQCPTLQGKNLRSSLNWLCLAIILLKGLFHNRGLFPWWKPVIYDRMMTTLVHYFFKTSLLEKLDFWCCLGGVSTELFFSLILPFLAMCTHNTVNTGEAMLRANPRPSPPKNYTTILL
jgi:hypothetical protein